MKRPNGSAPWEKGSMSKILENSKHALRKNIIEGVPEGFFEDEKLNSRVSIEIFQVFVFLHIFIYANKSAFCPIIFVVGLSHVRPLQPLNRPEPSLEGWFLRTWRPYIFSLIPEYLSRSNANNTSLEVHGSLSVIVSLHYVIQIACW